MDIHSPTSFTLQEVNHLLDYITTHPNNSIIYQASKMQLAAHSDAGYLNEPKAQSCASTHIFLSENVPILNFNRAILTIA